MKVRTSVLAAHWICFCGVDDVDKDDDDDDDDDDGDDDDDDDDDDDEDDEGVTEGERIRASRFHSWNVPSFPATL